MGTNGNNGGVSEKCYGSEYQLQKILNGNKGYFDKCVRDALRVAEDCEVEWLKCPAGGASGANVQDNKEWQGVAFLDVANVCGTRGKSIKDEWRDFWARGNNSMNWDAVLKVGGEIVVVEAKARIRELKGDKCGAKQEGRLEDIKKALSVTKEYFGVDSGKNWADSEYYQLANRLAFVYFLNERCNIKARLLYVYFLNGWDEAGDEERRQESVHSKEDWRVAIGKEYGALGIDTHNGNFARLVCEAFIDCEGS